MERTLAWHEYQVAAEFVRARTRHRPRLALVLGSGLNELADQVQAADVIPFGDIPHFHAPTVVGHVGRLVIGELAAVPVAVMQGRLHYYEGYSLAEVTFPIRMLKALGIQILILTNAAGGIRPTFQAGDLMLIEDHINLLGLGGANPLRGPNDEAIGPRFPDMSQAYDRELRLLAREEAAACSIDLQRGVYGGLAGPTFETPAEVRFLRLIGVDAVGMSTVPEVIVARHCGLRVLAISLISNRAISELDAETGVSHEEVLAAGRAALPRLARLLVGIVGRIGAAGIL